MVDIDKEFDEATNYTFDDRDIERAKLLLGVDVAKKHLEHVSTASYDSIRNFAWGVGDDNPLYGDEHYGETTRWGSQIAPNSMAQIIGAPMLGDPMPDDVKQQTKGSSAVSTSSCRVVRRSGTDRSTPATASSPSVARSPSRSRTRSSPGSR